MAVKLYPDRTLFVASIALVSFGLVMLYSASAVVAHDQHRSSHFFLIKQAMWAVCGLLVMLAATRFDYRRLRHPAIVYGALGVVVTLLIAVLFAPPLNNAHRWLRFGGLSFQPSEVAKLALVLCLAYQLDRRRERLGEFLSGWLPSLATTGLLAFLVLIEPDYSTAFCLVFIGTTLFFVSGVPLMQLEPLAALSRIDRNLFDGTGLNEALFDLLALPRGESELAVSFTNAGKRMPSDVLKVVERLLVELRRRLGGVRSHARAFVLGLLFRIWPSWFDHVPSCSSRRA